MSDSIPPKTDVRVTIRVPGDLAARIDVLARRHGRGRSEFLRACNRLADCEMVLAELRARQPRGSRASEVARAERVARRELAESRRALSPAPVSVT
jgi:metal-responsive CopG/Arc/MetJ family transcriptional regulator